MKGLLNEPFLGVCKEAGGRVRRYEDKKEKMWRKRWRNYITKIVLITIINDPSYTLWKVRPRKRVLEVSHADVEKTGEGMHGEKVLD